jgi:MoaA/NifB/PqqE/SkfB family radical SAM enzyme
MRTVIWNLTYNCCWDCKFCCVDAGRGRGTSCELTLDEKLAAAESLARIDCRIDLSGGELMMPDLKSDHCKLIGKLSCLMGRDRIGLSCSGANIDDATAEFLAGTVSDVEMTMDSPPGVAYPYRPYGYHQTAGKSADLLKKHGLKVGLQTVVTSKHLKNRDGRTLLHDLYDWMSAHEIDNWSLLKFFPSGRGEGMELEPSEEDCRKMVQDIREMERSRISTHKPKIDFHYLMPGSDKEGAGLCRCVRKSIGILPDGTVTACFWGLKRGGTISNDRFNLGNVEKTGMPEILKGNNARYWEERNMNRCGCALVREA